MKITVSIPDNLDTTVMSTFFEGVSFLKKQGHNIYETFFSQDNSKKESLKIDKAIKDSDILIAEAYYADSKVGFEIARAIDEKKVVVLFSDKAQKNISKHLSSINNNNIIYSKYSRDDIKESFATAIKIAASKMDTKFILIITPEINRYLDWAAQTKRMHKAQIVRTSVENLIKRDKEYKNYLKGK